MGMVQKPYVHLLLHLENVSVIVCGLGLRLLADFFKCMIALSVA